MHRWHGVFHDALTRSEVVGVQAAVRSYLRREPTRSEMNAARRAVASFAASEPVEVYQVPVKGVRMLLLARPGAEVDLGSAERAVKRRIGPSTGPRKPDTARLLQTIERGVETAVHASRQIEVDDLESSTAAQTEEVLTAALVDLQDLRRRLRRRSRSPA